MKPPDPNPEVPLPPLRILLVEDREDDALLIEHELRSGGIEVEAHRVETEEEVREALSDSEWNLVLADYNLPHFDAPSCIRLVQSLAPDLPVIVVSGTVGEDVAVETLQMGAVDYLLKQNLTRLAPAVRQAMDVSASRKAERALEGLKNLFLTYSPDLICLIDKEGVFIEVSSASEAILGYLPSEMASRPFQEFAHSDDVISISSTGESVASGSEAKNFETRFLHKSGRVVKLLWSAVWAPEVGQIVAIGRDVTEIKATQESLRLTLERLQLALRAGGAGTWDICFQTGKVRWDESMCELYGIERGPGTEEGGIEAWLQRIHEEDREKMSHFLESRDEKAPEPIEFRIHRENDGKTRILRAMASVSKSEQGVPLRLVGINLDVTQERERETKLAAALQRTEELAEKAQAGEKAKGEFLAVMSHEVRTPLNGILGFAQLLVNDSELGETSQSHAKTIVESGRALLRILDDILDFSRLEAGKTVVELAPFSPRELLAGIHTLLQPEAQAKGLDFQFVLPSSVPPVLLGDSGRLRQIFLNLVGNAIKFTSHGRVVFSIEPEEQNPGKFKFRVKDDGSGIATDHIEKIFDPFTQADSSISRKFGGTGLGLTISARLVELLGGKLSVQSVVGKGAEFQFSLPMQTPTHSEPTAASALPQKLDPAFAKFHPLKILLVEDDPVNLKLIKVLMTRLGYQTISATNGLEAIEVFQSASPDCILMDIQMPKMDGIEATQEIRKLQGGNGNSGRVFIAAITAGILPADRQRCMESGMDDYLNKPIRIDALSELLRRASKFLQQSDAISGV